MVMGEAIEILGFNPFIEKYGDDAYQRIGCRLNHENRCNSCQWKRMYNQCLLDLHINNGFSYTKEKRRWDMVLVCPKCLENWGCLIDEMPIYCEECPMFVVTSWTDLDCPYVRNDETVGALCPSCLIKLIDNGRLFFWTPMPLLCANTLGLPKKLCLYITEENIWDT